MDKKLDKNMDFVLCFSFFCFCIFLWFGFGFSSLPFCALHIFAYIWAGFLEKPGEITSKTKFWSIIFPKWCHKISKPQNWLLDFGAPGTQPHPHMDKDMDKKLDKNMNFVLCFSPFCFCIFFWFWFGFSSLPFCALHIFVYIWAGFPEKPISFSLVVKLNKKSELLS